MTWSRLKLKLSSIAKAALFHAGFFHLLRVLFPNRRVAVLRYHAVVEPKDNFYTSPGIALSIKEFERHVRYFARRYKVLSMDEVVDAITTDKQLPANAVVFTFDDGYADNWQAARILKKYGASGTFYLTTDCIDRKEPLWLFEATYLIQKSRRQRLELELNGQRQTLPLETERDKHLATREVVRIIKSNNRKVREAVRKQMREQLADENWLHHSNRVMLTWNQVMSMVNDGMVIGGHTMSHLNLPNADPEDAMSEIAGCKRLLQQKLSIPIRHFSVPNSGPYEYYNDSVKQMVQSAGFVSSVTSAHGFVGPDSELLALRRIRTVPQLHEVVATIELGKFSAK